MEPGGSETPANEKLGLWPVLCLVGAHAVLLAGAFWLARSFFAGSGSFAPSSSVGLGVLAGVGLAQLGLVSIWAVLGGGASTARALPSLLLVTLFLLVPAVPCVAFLFSLPLLTTQSGGMRLKRFARDNMPVARPLQFSMGYMVRITVVIAVLFALGQFGSQQRREHTATRLGEFGEVLAVFGVAIAAMSCGVIALTVPLVCLWAFLSPGRVLPRFAVSMVGWSLGAALLFPLIGGANRDFLFGMEVFVTSVFVLSITLLALRGMGYRAVWGEEL